MHLKQLYSGYVFAVANYLAVKCWSRIQLSHDTYSFPKRHFANLQLVRLVINDFKAVLDVSSVCG